MAAQRRFNPIKKARDTKVTSIGCAQLEYREAQTVALPDRIGDGLLQPNPDGQMA
jgi:hypothetical protein